MLLRDVNVFATNDELPDPNLGTANDIAITPYGIYSKQLKIATGFMVTGSDERFNGLWIDMGVNLIGTNDGNSFNTHWYQHTYNTPLDTQVDYALVWSDHGANPGNTAGYWFINLANNRQNDVTPLASYRTSSIPNSTAAPPSGAWSPPTVVFGTWNKFTSENPVELGWVLQLQLHTTPDGGIFLGNQELGVNRLVYERNDLVFNAAWPGILDTGVELIDGANYEIIITALSGTTGTSANTSNLLMPRIINANGEPIGTGFPCDITFTTTGMVSAYLSFRYQERIRASAPSTKSIFLNRLNNTFGSIQYAETAASTNIDNITTLAMNYPSASSQFAQRQTLNCEIVPGVENKLRIGIDRPSTGTTANMTILIKIFKRRCHSTGSVAE